MNDNGDELKSGVKEVISDISFGFSIRNLGYLPRWLILLFDIFIIIASGVITFFLFEGIKLNYIPSGHILFGVGFYLTLNIFFFWIFRTYSGIIRHSSYIDALKIVFSQFSVFVVVLIVNFILLFTGRQKLFLTTGIFVNVFLSFSFLFIFRIIVKQIFDKYFNNSTNSKTLNAVIYGTDSNSIAVANALKVEVPRRFIIKGFIDKKNQNSSKRILNLPILEIKKSIPVLLRLQKAEAIIIADKSLTNDEKLAIAEQCIDYNFKVFILPVVSDWKNQTEISKNIKSFQIHDLLDRNPIELDNNLISSDLKDKTILISGAAGSIGSEITRQVLKFNPKKILLLDQAETPLHTLSLEILQSTNNLAVETIIADVRNKEFIETIFKKHQPNIVYHAAAYKHVPMMEHNPSQAIFTNVLGTKNLADLSQKYKVAKFVMISTDKAVNPSSVMGASKRIAEMYVQSKHFYSKKTQTENTTKFITTRFGNVLGSNGSVVPLFSKQIQEGGPITITHPDIIRYFMTIPEACQLVLEAGSMGNGGEIYIFDMGKPVKIIDLARKMIKLAGFIPEKDIKIKIVGLRPGEKLYEELLNDTAKNLPTHHEKIMIAQEICDDYDVISNGIDQLIIDAKNNSNEQIVSKMKTIIPEYKSLNSRYEMLDIEVKESYCLSK